MDWLLFIALNLAELVLLAALTAWMRFGADQPPPIPRWLPLAGVGVAGGLAVASILAGMPLVAVGAAMNVAVFAIFFWQARRLRPR